MSASSRKANSSKPEIIGGLFAEVRHQKERDFVRQAFLALCDAAHTQLAVGPCPTPPVVSHGVRLPTVPAIYCLPLTDPYLLIDL